MLYLSLSLYYDSPSHQPSGRAGITQFHSDDDPFIPVAEAQHVARSLALGARFHLLSGCSHFFSKEDAVPILQAIQHAMAWRQLLLCMGCVFLRVSFVHVHTSLSRQHAVPAQA
jgi:hypothetical protein